MVISLAWLNKENTVNYFACRGQNQYSFHSGNKNYSILLYIHTYSSFKVEFLQFPSEYPALQHAPLYSIHQSLLDISTKQYSLRA